VVHIPGGKSGGLQGVELERAIVCDQRCGSRRRCEDDGSLRMGSSVSGGGLKGESTASKGSINLVVRHLMWSSDGEGQQRREDYTEAEAEASSGSAVGFRCSDKTD